MTNLDVIKLLAEEDPSLLVEFLEDIFYIGWNDGAADKMDHMYFNENWLNFPYDRNFFRETDINRLIERNGIYE